MKRLLSAFLLLLLVFGFLQIIQIQNINAEQSSGCWQCYRVSQYEAYCNAPNESGHFHCGQETQDDCVLTGPGCGT